MSKGCAQIDCREDLAGADFYSEYVLPRRPVLIRGRLNDWKAVRSWTPEYLAGKSPALQIPVKEFCGGTIKKTSWQLKDYVQFLGQFPSAEPLGSLPYCHDVPLFHAIPGLAYDASPFPEDLLPPYYRLNWWLYAQFFLGPKFSSTPLHFDCLLTNNLFFQIYGRKKFILFDPADEKHCYRDNWRWFRVNPEKPDYAAFPQFARARSREVVVEAGDILYMPPGMLHHVRSLDAAISFNIDWHTTSSAFGGICGLFRGMPLENVYYNGWIFLGVACKMPHSLVFAFYKRYLNYVS
jgi:hypothetical protein